MKFCENCNSEIEEISKEGIVYDVCHKCKRALPQIEVYSRVVGYMRPVKQWNKGKKEEWEDRKTFKL